MKSNIDIYSRNESNKVSVTLNSKHILPNEPFLASRHFRRAEVFLPFKYYAKRRNKDRFTQKVSIKIHEKYKIASVDLQRRLTIKSPTNDVLCATDVDKHFYNVINGQPLHSDMVVFKSLKKYVNNVLQSKQEIGIKKDYVLNIQVNHHNEMDVYDTCRRTLSEQVKYFDAFISEDYQKSMSYLMQWEKLKHEIDSKTEELRHLALEQFALKSRLIGLEYQYSVQQKYGRFLYYLSPPSWRLSNRDFARSVEIEAKGFDFIETNEENTFTVIFERLKSISYGAQVEPALYFRKSTDLMDIFDFMEKQQIHYYTHVTHLTPYFNILKKSIKYLKDSITKEYNTVASSIKGFEELLKFTELRCLQLEAKFYKILNGMFYDSVGSLDVLKLQLHLEFCYKTILVEPPANTDIITLAHSIETFYFDYSKRLDAIQNETVRIAMAKCIEAERLKTKRANDAAKELRSFYRLEKKLLQSHRIFSDTVYRQIKTIKKNNKASSSKKSTNENKKQSITESELEYLYLFTDWTEKEDPALYLRSLNTEENVSDTN